MLPVILPILLFTALVLALFGAVRRFCLWRKGRPVPVDWFGGLWAIRQRFFVDLHHVVARDKYMSNTHVATAGGFVAAAVLSLLVHGLGLHNRILGVALLLASAVMLTGAVFVAKRRLNPPSRLSKGPWMRLPKSLLMFSVSFFIVTLPVAGLISTAAGGCVLAGGLLIGIVWGISELFLGLTWGGPMKHAFAGALHLAWHRRAERFGGGRSTGLKALPLDESPTPSGMEKPFKFSLGQILGIDAIVQRPAPLGVEKPIDFTWNQLLGFDACVQCGRCEAMCPAFAAGQPLNPKKLIQDMVIGMTGGSDAQFAGSPYPGKPLGEHHGGPHQPIVRLDGKGLVDAETLWSCTTCRACVEECPMMIEHVDAIVDMRRYLTLEKGATPNKGAQVLENLSTTDNPEGFAPHTRMHWAADLNLPLMRDKQQADVLFWVGDGAFNMRSQRILRAFVKILRAAEVDFAVLGLEECDSGDLARRLGDEATFQSVAKRNIETLAHYHFKRIVTCDPHSFHVLKNEYGALGGQYEVLHHSGLIDELLQSGALQAGPSKVQRLTYHDPCYLGRYNGEYQAPRNVLKAIGIEIMEMPRSGFRSRCCGGGGGAPITDIPGKQRIPDMRMADIRDTGAEVVAVGCPQCTAMLEGVVEPRAEVMDIAELVAETLTESPAMVH